MNTCVYCGIEETRHPSWATFFVVNDHNLCGRCAEHLEKLGSPWCEVCSRPMKENGICSDCNRWESSAKWAGLIQRNRSVFQYNEWMQGYLAQLKYRGDAALANVFARNLQRIYCQQFDRCLLVPIPLSEQRMSERGFNQSEALANFSPEKIADVLVRTVHEDKMSKQGRKGRLSGSARPFVVVNANPILNQHVLLIDDVYTTGSTVRKAAKPLLEKGAISVSSLTLVRS